MYHKEEDLTKRMKVPECKKGKYIPIKPLDLIKVDVLRKFLKQLKEYNDVMCGMKGISFTAARNDPYFSIYKGVNREQ